MTLPTDTNLLCSFSRNPVPRLSDPLKKNHALSCHQGEQINRHDDILLKPWRKWFCIYVPTMVVPSRFNNGNRSFKDDLDLYISHLNGPIENFNGDISVKKLII